MFSCPSNGTAIYYYNFEIMSAFKSLSVENNNEAEDIGLFVLHGIFLKFLLR